MSKASSGNPGLFHDALPPELWLKVFPELPFESLPAVTLTCRLFRWMAQPLMFSVFDISPFFLNNGSERPVLRPKEYLDRTIQRLDFFCSQRIAPAVKHCWISPYSLTRRSHNGGSDIASDLIIDVTVKALPQFPNLRKLSWHCSDMTPQWWTVIQSLPLKSMWLNSSCTVETTGPSQLTIEFLDLDRWAWQGGTTNHDSMYELRSPGVSQSLMSSVIHPDHIQRISVPRDDTGRRLLSTIAAMDMLRCLRILSIPFAATTSKSFIPALIQCPNLEELRLLSTVFDPVQDHPITLLPSTLPSLAVYEGPYTHILTFAFGRPLRSVILWGYDDYPLCDPDLLLDPLYQLSMLDIRLESLDLSVTHLTNNILANLVLFPWLISVAIESVDASLLLSSLTVLYAALRNAILPPSLQSLRVTTRLCAEDEDGTLEKLELSNLIEHLARACPALQTVEIAYGTWLDTYIVRWHRLPSNDRESSPATGKISLYMERPMTLPRRPLEGSDLSHHPRRSIRRWLRRLVCRL